MLTVMIVDDMDITRRQVKRLKLWGEETGFVVSAEAKNGHEALVKLEYNPVDLVITDIKMPKINGLELLRIVTHKKLCSCVVLLSDYSDFSYVRQGLIFGAFDYLKKPVDEREFAILLQRAKAFIVDKRKEQERIKKLEQKFYEKDGAFFVEADIIQLNEQIRDGDSKIFEAVSRLVDRIGATFNYDVIKIEGVLKNMLLEIVNTTLEDYGWLEKFANIKELANADFSKCNTFDSVRKAFIASIEKIVVPLNKLQCGKQKSSIVSQVCKCVLTNVDSEISLKSVSDTLFMNKTYISETFKLKTGMLFVEYITMVKMERAKKLITEGKHKIYEISDKLGYKDVEYFSRLFKKYTGSTPAEYRQNIL